MANHNLLDMTLLLVNKTILAIARFHSSRYLSSCSPLWTSLHTIDTRQMSLRVAQIWCHWRWLQESCLSKCRTHTTCVFVPDQYLCWIWTRHNSESSETVYWAGINFSSWCLAAGQACNERIVFVMHLAMPPSLQHLIQVFRHRNQCKHPHLSSKYQQDQSVRDLAKRGHSSMMPVQRPGSVQNPSRKAGFLGFSASDR